jgi:hypothetical protein
MELIYFWDTVAQAAQRFARDRLEQSSMQPTGYAFVHAVCQAQLLHLVVGASADPAGEKRLTKRFPNNGMREHFGGNPSFPLTITMAVCHKTTRGHSMMIKTNTTTNTSTNTL